MAKARAVAAVAAGVACVAAETMVSLWLLGGRPTDAVMVYLLGVVGIALRFGYVPSFVTAVVSVAAFDFFFTEPYYSLAIEDKRWLLTFLIMLAIALVVSRLAEQVRRHAERTAALALERARLAEEAQRVHAEVENTRLRNALLSSVSHDLRTPLAVVQGAATALLDGGDSLPLPRRHEYLRTISDEAGHLNRLVGNLVDMTVLQTGGPHVRKQWHPLEEIVGVALNRVEDALGSRPVEVRIAEDASFVAADQTLLQQVIVNLVENATRYTPPGSPICVTAERLADGVQLEVADSGPGVPAGQEEAIFEKFHRGGNSPGGMGLGLTICRGIVAAHGGRIWCENRKEGGAAFRFVLPFEGEPPAIAGLPEAEMGPT